MESQVATPTKPESFVHQLQSHSSALGEGANTRVQEAILKSQSLAFPTTRMEEWKYTRTTRISSEAWTIQQGNDQIDIQPYLIPSLDAHIIVFVNGHFSSKLSSFETSEFSISQEWNNDDLTIADHDVFSALNTAYTTGAMIVRIPAKQQLSKAIHFIYVTDSALALSELKIRIEAGKSSKSQIVESFVSLRGDKTFTHRQMMIQVGSNAGLQLHKIQLEQDEQFLLNEDTIDVDADARFHINTLTVDGGWVRNSLHIHLNGTNIETHLNGIYLPRRRQLVDNHTKVDHRHPHCNSNELYKGILNDQSTGVFNGKVYVQLDAQKTNAYQSNANVLLSNDAQMNTKPELEIYADDVKCSHGTTTGQLDHNALFYLKSRGMGDDNARRLLTTAFIHDVLEKVENEAVKNYVIDELLKRDLLFV